MQKNVSSIIITICILICHTLTAQDYNLKKKINSHELVLIQKTIKHVKEKDQKFRKFIAAETLDEKIINKIDSMYDSLGIQGGYAYKKSLNLNLEQSIKDSLWEKQHLLDFQNHITVRGLIETYGYLSEDVVGKDDYVQFIVLVHPPVDWDVSQYLSEYAKLLKHEVFTGRMKPNFFAQFYDNMNCKILKKPQLYGTNQEFNFKTKSMLPPEITNIKITNTARQEIGLEPLMEGEYRVAK